MDSGGGSTGEPLDEMPPCSSDQEVPPRLSVAVMGSGCGRSGAVFDGMPQTRSRSEFDAGVSLWAGLQPDILGVVLRFLPCLADRARVRSVCRHWRAGAQGHVLPPPLPILVLPEFKFSGLSEKGDLMPVQRALMPKELPADDLRCVGSFDGWLVCVTPTKDRGDEYYGEISDYKCFLVNAFSRKVVCLPQDCSMPHNLLSYYSAETVWLINGSGVVHFTNKLVYVMAICQVVLSAAPDLGSNYIVAASSNDRAGPAFALWQPGMVSWHVCSWVDIDGPKDIAFHQGKLYVLTRYRAQLFTCELVEDDHGFMVSRDELCLPELPGDHHVFYLRSPFRKVVIISCKSCNMVVWRGELLLIIRHYNGSSNYHNRKVLRVQVFALDINTNPCGLTEIHNFNGDCMLVGSGGCKSFPASLHDGVEGDLIYFVPDDWEPYDRFVYSMRDGRMRPFASELLACYAVPQENFDFPVWLLPSN